MGGRGWGVGVRGLDRGRAGIKSLPFREKKTGREPAK